MKPFDIDAVMLHWQQNFAEDSLKERTGLEKGKYYFDPENERVVQFLCKCNLEQELRFIDFETGELFHLCEWEVGSGWRRMNEMEVLAWASGR